jgi:hypothetical protein
MRFFLSGIILLLVFAHIFSLDLSLAPGLSAKNAVLYIAASLIAFRIVVTRDFKLEMGGFIACYLALVTYAIATWLVAGLFIGYKGYTMLSSFIALKNNLVDPLIFFLTFFIGTRNSADAIKTIKVILIGGVLMHLATLGDAFHIYSLGDYVEPGSNGRMAGPIGEANAYAYFIAMFLPPMIAAMVVSRGVVRVFWLFAIAVSLAALLTTYSPARSADTCFAATSPRKRLFHGSSRPRWPALSSFPSSRSSSVSFYSTVSSANPRLRTSIHFRRGGLISGWRRSIT